MYMRVAFKPFLVFRQLAMPSTETAFKSIHYDFLVETFYITSECESMLI